MPIGKDKDRVFIVVKKTLKASLERIAEKEGESASAVGAQMLAKGVAAYERKEKA